MTRIIGHKSDRREDLAVDEITIQDLVTDHVARVGSYELLGGML